LEIGEDFSGSEAGSYFLTFNLYICLSHWLSSEKGRDLRSVLSEPLLLYQVGVRSEEEE
jgi:hypothetical protein